jgi:hypothetical protein
MPGSNESSNSWDLQNLVRIDVYRDMDVTWKRQAFNGRSDVLTKAADPLGSEENLVPIISFGSFNWGRNDRVEDYAWVQFFAHSAMDGFSGEFRAPLVFRADMDHQQMEKRRVVAPLSELNFLLPEALKIMMSRELDRGTKRCGTLDIDFSSHIAAPRATGYLS